MEIEDIRTMIQQSLREQVKNLIEERLKPPTSFEKFNSLVNESLEDVIDKPAHGEVYDMWRNISAEMSCIQNEKAKIAEWNSSLSYYINKLNVPRHTKSSLFNHLKR